MITAITQKSKTEKIFQKNGIILGKNLQNITWEKFFKKLSDCMTWLFKANHIKNFNRLGENIQTLWWNSSNKIQPWDSACLISGLGHFFSTQEHRHTQSLKYHTRNEYCKTPNENVTGFRRYSLGWNSQYLFEKL